MGRKTVVGKYKIDLPPGLTKESCERCGKKNRRIDTHRILPGSCGGLYVPGNIISLCRSCHHKEHFRMKREQDEKELGFSKDKEVTCFISKEMKYRLKHIAINTGMPLGNLLPKILFDFVYSPKGKRLFKR